jgi:hypothetical protein
MLNFGRQKKHMFMPSEKVICVDDTNPNPLCKFPCGYVVRGRIYHVKGVTLTGGVQIEGLPVVACFRSFYAAMNGLPPDREFAGDVGWKRHRFRRYDERNSEQEVRDPAELELVGA